MKNAFVLPKDLEAQAYLAAIISSSDDAIISKDLNGNITSWNNSATRIFGYNADEVIGKHISLLIPPERLPEEDYILSQLRQGKRIEHFETERRRKDGKLVNISATISPIKNKDGTVIGASKVARDITELKIAERAGLYLGSIIESSDDAIISKDLNGFVTSWNKSSERIFGYKAEEVIGKHITIIIPADRLSEEDKILTTLKTGDRVDHFETMRRHKDGHLIPVSLTVSPIKDSTGKIIGASKVSRDISDRIKSEKALTETNRKKDEFLANMSHELRTPMNAVIGLATLLEALDGMPEKAKKYIETLKISADNLMDLINDLLDFAKIESNSIEVENIEFDLAEQVEKAISVANVKAREKDLKLFVNYSPSLNRTYIGDPLRIHQVLMNVLSNAVKFTVKGSVEVDINGIVKPNTDVTLITFKVSDTGIGIAQDKIHLIFDKFMQADSSITRKFGGSGLGLAISKALTEKMGGEIEVDSQLGIGTTFTFTIPLRNTEKVSKVESFTASASSTAAKAEDKNVLVVEDYEPNVMVVGAMLDKLGYHYEVAQNGFEAIRKFVHGRFDVILMDVQMHDLDGLEATRKIRRMESEKNLPRTPIVALTAHVREQDKAKCIEAGMDDFIPKPFNPQLLEQKIGRYIRVNREMEQLSIVADAKKRT